MWAHRTHNIQMKIEFKKIVQSNSPEKYVWLPVLNRHADMIIYVYGYCMIERDRTIDTKLNKMHQNYKPNYRKSVIITLRRNRCTYTVYVVLHLLFLYHDIHTCTPSILSSIQSHAHQSARCVWTCFCIQNIHTPTHKHFNIAHRLFVRKKNIKKKKKKKKQHKIER